MQISDKMAICRFILLPQALLDKILVWIPDFSSMFKAGNLNLSALILLINTADRVIVQKFFKLIKNSRVVIIQQKGVKSLHMFIGYGEYPRAI